MLLKIHKLDALAKEFISCKIASQNELYSLFSGIIGKCDQNMFAKVKRDLTVPT